MFSVCAWTVAWNVSVLVPLVVCSRLGEQQQRRLCPQTCDLYVAQWSHRGLMTGLRVFQVRQQRGSTGRWGTLANGRAVSCEPVNTAWTRSSAGPATSAVPEGQASHGHAGVSSGQVGQRRARLAACGRYCCRCCWWCSVNVVNIFLCMCRMFWPSSWMWSWRFTPRHWRCTPSVIAAYTPSLRTMTCRFLSLSLFLIHLWHFHIILTSLHSAHSESVSVSPPGDRRQSFCRRSDGSNLCPNPKPYHYRCCSNTVVLPILVPADPGPLGKMAVKPEREYMGCAEL